MDPSRDAVSNRLSVPETEAHDLGSPNSPSNPPDTNSTPIQSSVDVFEPSDSAPSTQPRVPTPPLTVEPGEEIEHAYWAELEEDTTTPDEAELKEIDGADADYSACDRKFFPNLTGDSRGSGRLLTPWQIRIGKTISFGTWTTLSTLLVRRPA